MRTAIAMIGLGLAALFAAPTVARAEELSVGGLNRSFDLYVPAAVAAARKPAPLVLVLHGGGGTSAQMRQWTGFDQIADRNGFVVAYPQAVNKNWNDGRAAVSEARHAGAPPDDVRFLTALVSTLATRGIADPARAYVTGASNGGMMTYRLACETQGVFAGYAAVIANMSVELAGSCKPKGPVRMLMMPGTADEIMPYRGGAIAMKRGTVISALDTFAFWSKYNGCVPGPFKSLPNRVSDDGSTVELATCPTGSTAMYLVIGGGHQWPSPTRVGRPMIDRFLGATNRDIDASDVIWQFFAGSR